VRRAVVAVTAGRPPAPVTAVRDGAAAERAAVDGFASVGGSDGRLPAPDDPVDGAGGATDASGLGAAPALDGAEPDAANRPARGVEPHAAAVTATTAATATAVTADNLGTGTSASTNDRLSCHRMVPSVGRPQRGS
jgi:hypothetical protein